VAGIIAEGHIVPKESTELFFQSGGMVEEVLVEEADLVTKGSALVRLSDSQGAGANLAAAQVELLAAQQAVDDLTRTASLAYQQAMLDEIAAETAYYEAQADWDEFDEDAQETEIDDARARVATAETDLEDAQDEFDKYAALDEDNADRQRTKTAVDNAEQAYHEAQAELADLENEGDQLKAELQRAEDQLDEASRTRQQRKDGPDPDELALAEARLESATAALAGAQTALDHLTLMAPYDGVVARLAVAPGEWVTPNAPVISFADFSEWYVETSDLSENEIIDVHAGQGVIAVPDVLPALELEGQVESIAQTYTEKAGDIVYKTRIRLSPTDETRLRWGMTVEVRFAESD
jgi:multidrug resistance efflux pump